MVDRVLLALTATSGDRPACLLENDGDSLVSRLVTQLAAVGSSGGSGDVEVAVVTWARWVDAIRAAVPAPTVVRGVSSHGDAVRAVVALAGGELVLAHAHLMANDLALGRVADPAARGTAAVVGPLAGAAAVDGTVGSDRIDGTPVRVTRGRVVAAASGHHTIEHAGATARRVVRIGAPDRPAADPHLVALADLLDGWAPATGPVAVGSVPDGAEATEGVDPPDDLVALVLVALVRGGVPVTATTLPAGSVWDHPRSPAQVAHTAGRLGSIDEERQRLAAAVKADDGFFTTYAVSSYSRYWARWAARRGYTPNQVSSVSMLLGVVAACAFAVGDRWWALAGAVLLQLAFTLDCVDGQLARYSRQFSALGAWLDSVFDRGKEYVVYAGLAVGGLRAGDGTELWLLAAAALALQTFRHTLDLGYAEQQLADLDNAVVQPLAVTAERGPSFWEAVPASAPVAPRSGASATTAGTTGAMSLPRRVIGLLRRAETIGILRWAKRIVILPIGERFALISVLAVVSGPRTVFLALLIWGALATAYTAVGRVVRSFA